MNNRGCAGGNDFFANRTMIWAAVCVTWSASAFGQDAASAARPLDLHYRAETQVSKPPISVCEYNRSHKQAQDKELRDSLADRGDGVATAPVMTVTDKCPEYLDLQTFHNPIEYKPTAFDKYWKDKKRPSYVGMAGIPLDLTDALVSKRPAEATPSPFDPAQMDKQAKLWNQANPDLPQEVQDLDGSPDEKRQAGGEEDGEGG